ncbi:MAG: ABC transporter ATP-binding protein [Mycoplasmataceae bacterium]|jgi:ABC-2 type transport system ATP-binding protein|nr:ABC transporter ATP-binding protein [Mycoplasmataceae bacterium]
MDAITVQNLKVKMKLQVLLDDVSFTVPYGVTCAFIGHNGAGKTTTIRSILGLREYDSGEITIAGVNAKYKKSRVTIGYVPEKGSADKIKVIDFLRNIADFKNVSKSELDSFVETTCKELNIPVDRLQNRICDLSSGQNKLITIAQAFIGAPDIVFMDEPTDNLDPEARELFYEFIKNQRKINPRVTYFISTHNLDEIEHYIDYVVIIRNGQIKHVGPYKADGQLRKNYSEFVKTGIFHARGHTKKVT